MTAATPPSIFCLLFFADSTRTRFGFQSAAYKLSGQVLALTDTKFEVRMSTAESIEDTVRSLEEYTDAFYIRSNSETIFEKILPYTKKPIINCGNGYDEHPTQSLIDLFTLYKEFGTIDGLILTLVGDLRHMRTVHSLMIALSNFTNITVNVVAPPELQMPAQYTDDFIAAGNTLIHHGSLPQNPGNVVYAAGFAPHTPIGSFSEDVRKNFIITEEYTRSLDVSTKILCPLPRIDEIETSVDALPHATYFKQSAHALYMRMAIMDYYR